jgi:hypothetical protein
MAHAKALFQRSGNLEKTLCALRSEGWDQLDSVLFVKEVQRCDMSQAKQTIHDSSTWADMRKSAEQVHDLAEKVARELAEDN